MKKRFTKAAWTALLLKPVLLIGIFTLADRMTHLLGFQTCLLTSLADSLAGFTGLSDTDCVGLLVTLAAVIAFQVGRAFFGLVAAYF